MHNGYAMPIPMTLPVYQQAGLLKNKKTPTYEITSHNRNSGVFQGHKTHVEKVKYQYLFL